jgi:hypothetical protein
MKMSQRLIYAVVLFAWFAMIFSSQASAFEPTTDSMVRRASFTAFTVRGESPHWRVIDLFTPADFGTQAYPDPGYEFGPWLTFRGPVVRIHWFRIEPLFSGPVTIQARPGRPMKRGSCVIAHDASVPEGAILHSGQTFRFGRCSVYPWAQGANELVPWVTKGIYLVTWEDETGVNAEPVRVRVIARNAWGYPPASE